jgi:glucosamine-6-phosphate deaminase
MFRGHIGFNEWESSFEETTQYAIYSEETVRRDVRRGQPFQDHVSTQRIMNILEAKEIVVIAFGEEKGRDSAEALYGEINPECPASALRMVGKK